ncbi:MAG: TM0106 family RecB-like putative nuclease [Gammaproteobacteria bacterium]|nr:MAG: TM0106 family RecB-like putative nuclease [Gammaproteobacteria bacterium]
MTAGDSAPILIKPSDASAWISCIRRVWLDKHRPSVSEPDAFNRLLSELGLEHEAVMLARLESQYPISTAVSFEHTQALMQQGAAVIYQGRLMDERQGLVGYPDFLIRHDSGHYQPADAKLSLSENKKSIQIQLGIYRRLLRNELPALVFLGDGRIAQLGDEVESLVDEFITGMRALLDLPQPPAVRYSHSKCRICPHAAACRPEFEAKEDISLLYGVHGQAADHLEEAGVSTISELAVQSIESIPDVPHLKGHKRKHRAILQARSFLSGEVFQLNKAVLPRGTWIHFDIEDNPLTPDRKRHVYLWGFLVPPHGRENFEYVWSDDEVSDYQGWLGFLQQIDRYRAQYPDLVLAHYSNHERATIGKYAERYGMTQHATVTWLLGADSPLFDMQNPVLDCLVLPLQGYGLKDICKHPGLVNFQWENAESGSQWSVVQFNRFRAETSLVEKQKLKAAILGYNRDDVIATRRLEVWLREHFS